jgi:hypothetical protein
MKMIPPLLVGVAIALGALPTARAEAPSDVVTFSNEMPAAYRLTRVRLVVDGAVRYDAPAPFAAAELGPGGHVVEVIATYRLHDPVFTYLDRYAIDVRSAHVVRPGSAHRVDAHVVRSGGATTPIDRRAAITWRDR